MKHSVVILQDSEASIASIKRAVEGLDDYLVVGVSTDGEKGIEMIKNLNPEIVVTGIILKEVDGFGVLNEIKRSGRRVKAMVVSCFTREEIIRKALALDALYYIVKPFKEDILKTRLLELTDTESAVIKDTSFEKKRNTLDEKISKIFISVGIPPHIKGYYYLREGVKMAVDNPDVINNITKQLYPMIGEKYQTTASKVERAIRHAIEVAWNRGRIETINTLLGIRAYVGNEKPTNGEFIALIADKMLLEGA